MYPNDGYTLDLSGAIGANTQQEIGNISILLYRKWHDSGLDWSTYASCSPFLLFFLKMLFIIFRERRREGEREEEKHQSVASHTSPAGDLAHNPCRCPDWESNRRPFSLKAGTQPTEPHQPGQPFFSFPLLCFLHFSYDSKRKTHYQRTFSMDIC